MARRNSGSACKILLAGSLRYRRKGGGDADASNVVSGVTDSPSPDETGPGSGFSAAHDASCIAVDEIMPCLRPFGRSSFRLESAPAGSQIDGERYDDDDAHQAEPQEPVGHLRQWIFHEIAPGYARQSHCRERASRPWQPLEYLTTRAFLSRLDLIRILMTRISAQALRHCCEQQRFPERGPPAKKSGTMSIPSVVVQKLCRLNDPEPLPSLRCFGKLLQPRPR